MCTVGVHLAQTSGVAHFNQKATLANSHHLLQTCFLASAYSRPIFSVRFWCISMWTRIKSTRSKDKISNQMAMFFFFFYVFFTRSACLVGPNRPKSRLKSIALISNQSSGTSTSRRVFRYTSPRQLVAGDRCPAAGNDWGYRLFFFFFFLFCRLRSASAPFSPIHSCPLPD